MLDCISNARCRALRNTKQSEGAIRSRRIDNGFQISGPLIKCQRADLPVTHTAAALVVAHKSAIGGEELDPVSPNGALPFEFQMREPVGGFDDELASSRFRPRQARPIRRLEIANVLPRLVRNCHWGGRDICLISRRQY